MIWRWEAGFYGKLPSRGDFVRSCLAAGLIDMLDDWITARVGHAKTIFGDAFETLWYRAPGWRFALRPGVLDPLDAVSGIWLPSIDASGRCFPLVMAIRHSRDHTLADALEPLGTILHHAVVNGDNPDLLQARLETCCAEIEPRAATVEDVSRWWPDPAICDDVTLETGLPDDDSFLTLLDLNIPDRMPTI